MKTSQLLFLIISLIFLYFSEILTKTTTTIRTRQDDEAKKQNLKELKRDNERLVGTITKLKDVLKTIKERIQSDTEENDRIKKQINEKKEELNMIKNKKSGSSKKNKDVPLVNEENSVFILAKIGPIEYKSNQEYN